MAVIYLLPRCVSSSFPLVIGLVGSRFGLGWSNQAWSFWFGWTATLVVAAAGVVGEGVDAVGSCHIVAWNVNGYYNHLVSTVTALHIAWSQSMILDHPLGVFWHCLAF